MPRIYTSDSDPIDFCLKCFPTEDVAKKKFGQLNNGPDNRGNCFGYDDVHPPYEEDDYHCHSCKKPLKEKDNYRS